MKKIEVGGSYLMLFTSLSRIPYIQNNVNLFFI